MRNEYLEILGLYPGATEKEIRTAYRTLAKKYHPDINKDENARAKFIKITEAYKFLTDVGPRPNKEFVDYNYDSKKAEFDAWRERAKTYARKRAAEEAAYQQSLLNIFYHYFNYIGIAIIAFNILLLMDFYLPMELRRDYIISVKEIYFKPHSRARIHQYDEIIFNNLRLRFEKEATSGLSGAQAIIYTTPIFNAVKQVGLQFESGDRILIPLNRIYRVLFFMIPAVIILMIIYYKLNNFHYNKNTFAIAVSVLLFIEVFLIFTA